MPIFIKVIYILSTTKFYFFRKINQITLSNYHQKNSSLEEYYKRLHKDSF